MKNFIAFFKKELLDARRSAKMLILFIVFVLFGIMNPAIAKLTPWMIELLSDQLAQSGMTVGEVTVDAAASWVQFVKNIPLALIIYILVCGSIFTKEYQSGTLVLLLTKGLRRVQVLLAKAVILLLGWTACYFLCFGITYGYNAFFWDNSIMQFLPQIALGWWLFGVWTVTLTVFFSAAVKTTSGVLLGTVGGVALSYIAGLLPKLAPYVPTSLMSVTDGNITKAVLVTVVMSAAMIVLAIPLFNKKEL